VYVQLKTMARDSLTHAFLPGASLWATAGAPTPVVECAATLTMGVGEKAAPSPGGGNDWDVGCLGELAQLFGADPKVNNGGVFFKIPDGEEIPLWCCWAALAVLCGICLFMLQRKIRGAEVIK